MDMAFDDYDMPVIINVKPEDQLDLVTEELEKEVSVLSLYGVVIVIQLTQHTLAYIHRIEICYSSFITFCSIINVIFNLPGSSARPVSEQPAGGAQHDSVLL